MVDERRLMVLVLDGRPVRSANLVGRVGRFLKQNMDPLASEVHVQVRIECHSSVDTCDVATALDSADAAFLLLHDPNLTRTFRGTLAKRLARDPRRPKCKVIVFGGGSLDETSITSLREQVPNRQQWLETCPGVLGDSPDEHGADAGLDADKPAIEKALAELLGVKDPQPYLAPPRASGDNTEASVYYRHDLANAFPPVRQGLEIALQGLDVNVHELLHDSQRLVKLWEHKLPDHVRQLNHRLVSLLKPEEVKLGHAAIQDALSIARELCDYARSLRPPARSVGDIPALYNEFKAGGTVKLLWIDDDEQWFQALNPQLFACGIEVTFVPRMDDWQAAPRLAAKHDAVLVDIMLRGQGKCIQDALSAQMVSAEDAIVDANAGVGIVRLLRHNWPSPPVFMLSADATLDVVQACTRLGAINYFPKQDLNLIRLVTDIRREVARHRKEEEQRRKTSNGKLIVLASEDPAMEALLDLDKYARRRLPVILLGESGSGKEEFAYEYGLRAGGAFYPVNGGELAASLHASDLRGHKGGSFTDAREDSPGIIEEADGGVLFIDEIDKLEKPVQAALITFLSNHKVRRVGGRESREVNVAVIMATNRNLNQLLDEGVLLSDWRRRLGHPVVIPSLQQRAQVVDAIAKVLVHRIWTEQRRAAPKFDPGAAQWLRSQAASGAFRDLNFTGLKELLEEVEVGPQEADTVTETMLSGTWAKQRARWEGAPRCGGNSEAPERAAALALYDQIIQQPGQDIREILERVEGNLWHKFLDKEPNQKKLSGMLGMDYDLVRRKICDLRKKGLLTRHSRAEP